MKNNVGVLLPVASLPGPHGIGDFGDCAKRFVSWLKQKGFSYWQILPLNPVGPSNSPYLTTCSKAFDIRYISLDYLVRDGLLDQFTNPFVESNRIDYKKVDIFKKKMLYVAYEKFVENSSLELLKFIENNIWALHYATYQIFKEDNDGKCWNDWPEWQINWFKNTDINVPPELNKRIYFEVFMQYIASKQWNELREFTKNNSIKIIADMPFYVGCDSIDCWLHKEEFTFDENNRLYEVGGCPPDAFSDDGQLWGSPIYKFDVMKENGYQLLIDRISYLSKTCDVLRLDHFRAFDTYYVIPAYRTDAKVGEWKIGPRSEFFDKLYESNPEIDIIAEDLGILFPSVYELRDKYNLPGMYVLQFFVFEPKLYPNENTIVYTGTHDNETLLGWYDNLNEYDKGRLNEMLKYPTNIHSALINYVMNLPSKITIFPIQDLLGLDNSARINLPGTTIEKNWSWKLENFDFELKTIL